VSATDQVDGRDHFCFFFFICIYIRNNGRDHQRCIGRASGSSEPLSAELEVGFQPRPGGNVFSQTVLESLPVFPQPSLSFPLSPPSSVLARPNMLLAETFLPLLLFTSVTNALRNGRLLRHQLETSLGHEPIRRRSLKDVAFTVKVICRHVSPSLPLIADYIFNPLQLKIDHFGSGSGTFENRYWINDTYYDGGPVFGARRTVLTGPSVDLSFGQSST
jgi:hypothetical protein